MNPILMQSGWRHALAVLTLVLLAPIAVANLYWETWRWHRGVRPTPSPRVRPGSSERTCARAPR
jgi:hypothetical protein